jgi:hypothetical protein
LTQPVGEWRVFSPPRWGIAIRTGASGAKKPSLLERKRGLVGA